jgi:hypothetical protein
MSVQGKNSKSYKKQSTSNQNYPHTGFKNLVFGHQFASAGETVIPFDALVTPTDWPQAGLVNPTSQTLLAAQLQVFKDNITVTSSARGIIQKSEYVVRANQIEFLNIESLANEAFEVEVADLMITGNLIVDLQTIRIQGEMQDGETDFNLGYDFDVIKEEVIVFRDGIQMFRADNNDSSGTTGNYYYVDDDGDGRSQIIRFFEPAVGVEPVLVATTGGVVDPANVSTFQQIESLQGQLDAVIPTVAALAGVPETNFRAGPNNVDLKTFGDLLLQLKADAGKVGDVKTSMLTEAQFQAQHNDTWVLMDGRGVGGSTYETITGSSTIPDARGQFLRGKNNGRADGQENPDGDVALGTYQADEFASHNHGGGNHNHTYNKGGSDAFNGPFSDSTNDQNPPDGVTDNSGVIINTEGGNETRPKNVTINYFIKINV